MREAKLPSGKQAVVVYPMFMQSGISSGEKLEAELKAAYAEKGQEPEFFIQPVLGASPWLVERAAESLQKLMVGMTESVGILVVAHGAATGQIAAPEPELFCRRLGKMLPEREIALSEIGSAEDIIADMAKLKAAQIVLLPFLMTRGMHFTRDLPTREEAAAVGKELHIHPVVGDFLPRSVN